MGGSSGSKTTYEQSPEQRSMYHLMQGPLFKTLEAMGLTATPGAGYGYDWGTTEAKPLWNVPEMPQYGAMPTFNLPQYGAMPNVPGAVLPTSGWMSSIAPEIMSGVREPYMEGQRQLMETLGAGGQLGSAGGGFSGAGAVGLGEYWAKASPQIGLQAWNMIAPEQMRYGQQQYQQGMLGREQEYGRQLLGAQTAYQQGMLGREQEYARGLQQRQDIMAASQAPYQFLPAIMGGMVPTYGQGITTQPQNAWERYGGDIMNTGAMATLLAK